MNDPAEPTDVEWDGLVEVGKYPTLQQAHEHGLVILAMREPCLIAGEEQSGSYTLHAEPAAAAGISKELLTYASEQEQTTPPPMVPDLFQHGPGWLVCAAWMITLVLVFLRQMADPSLAENAASSSLGLIGRHEWWRPFTALFLHGDVPHLIGNLLSGLLFGTLVSRSIGPLRGWALILLTGTLGNAITSALTWPEDFVSLGASTAVFGALGILSGLGFSAMLRLRLRLPWARVTAPVVAGVVLLGWLGGGSPGGNTDVLGHVFGFTSGLAAGLATGFLSPATAGASTAGTSTAAHDARI